MKYELTCYIYTCIQNFEVVEVLAHHSKIMWSPTEVKAILIKKLAGSVTVGHSQFSCAVKFIWQWFSNMYDSLTKCDYYAPKYWFYALLNVCFNMETTSNNVQTNLHIYIYIYIWAHIPFNKAVRFMYTTGRAHIYTNWSHNKLAICKVLNSFCIG